MEKLIMSTQNVGVPVGTYKEHHKSKHTAYFVTWYLKGTSISYHVMGPPILIAATSLLAAKANAEFSADCIDEVISELDVAENMLHHVYYTHSALMNLLDSGPQSEFYRKSLGDER